MLKIGCMVFLQRGKDMSSTCPEKLGFWLPESIRETEPHWLNCSEAELPLMYFFGGCWNQSRGQWEGILSRHMLTGWGKWLLENQPSAVSANSHPHYGTVSTLSLPLFHLNVGGASPLRTKATRLLRFGFYLESTTSPLISRFPGLITIKQGTHACFN